MSVGKRTNKIIHQTIYATLQKRQNKTKTRDSQIKATQTFERFKLHFLKIHHYGGIKLSSASCGIR